MFATYPSKPQLLEVIAIVIHFADFAVLQRGTGVYSKGNMGSSRGFCTPGFRVPSRGEDASAAERAASLISTREKECQGAIEAAQQEGEPRVYT